jgi:hypothetical protein
VKSRKSNEEGRWKEEKRNEMNESGLSELLIEVRALLPFCGRT